MPAIAPSRVVLSQQKRLACQTSLLTTIRSSHDLWHSGAPASAFTATTTSPPPHKTNVSLFPGAALRILDHHLHASRIIPHAYGQNERQHKLLLLPQLYHHAWLCANQSVAVYSLRNNDNSLSTEDHDDFNDDWILRAIVEQSAGITRSHVWVTSVGRSSLVLGNYISIQRPPSSQQQGNKNTDKKNSHGENGSNPLHILAAAQRVFVRKNLADLSAAPFDDTERERFERDCGPDDLIQQILRENDGGSTGSSTNKPMMPPLERLPTTNTLSGAADETIASPPLWTVPVGPQHLNFGNHANHAFIFDTAWQVLPTKAMAMTYVAEVGVHDVLQCRKDPRNEEIIWVTRDSSSESKSLQQTSQEIVAVAKALGQ